MYGDYLVLCGMVWGRFGEQDAGLELIRALHSEDEAVRVLARTLLEQTNGGSRELLGEALALDEISPSMANLCGFDKDTTSGAGNFSSGTWFAPARA